MLYCVANMHMDSYIFTYCKLSSYTTLECKLFVATTTIYNFWAERFPYPLRKRLYSLFNLSSNI